MITTRAVRLPPDYSAIEKAAFAYKQNRADAERYYEHAHPIIQHLIEGYLRNNSIDQSHHEDIIQEAHIRIWRYIKQGVVPDVRLHAFNTTVDSVRKTERRPKTTNIGSAVSDDDSDDRALTDLTLQVEEATITAGAVELAACRAEREHWMYGKIIRAMAMGGTAQIDVAKYVGVNDSTLRRAVCEMRENKRLAEDIDAILSGRRMKTRTDRFLGYESETEWTIRRDPK